MLRETIAVDIFFMLLCFFLLPSAGFTMITSSHSFEQSGFLIRVRVTLRDGSYKDSICNCESLAKDHLEKIMNEVKARLNSENQRKIVSATTMDFNNPGERKIEYSNNVLGTLTKEDFDIGGKKFKTLIFRKNLNYVAEIKKHTKKEEFFSNSNENIRLKRIFNRVEKQASSSPMSIQNLISEKDDDEIKPWNNFH